MFKLERKEMDAPYVSHDRLYLNSKGEVVGEDDADKQTLIAAVGSVLSAEKARQYGLVVEDANPMPAPAPAPAPKPAPKDEEPEPEPEEESKAKEAAPENKAKAGPPEKK